MKHLLSKSQFVRGSQCHKSLWLYRNQKELMSPFDEADQMVLDQGTDFGRVAQDRFPGGVLIKADHTDPDGALAETAAAIEKGATTLYEAAFVHEDVLVRVDVAVRRGDLWQLFEVKSSGEVSEVYLMDAAVQRWVMEGAGLKVDKVFIVHVNKDYVRQGPLDLDALFTLADVTAVSVPHLAEVPSRIALLKTMLARKEAPPTEIGGHCFKPYECGFKDHCFKAAGVPDYSVFNLAYGKTEKKVALWQSGVKNLVDVPGKLSPNQEVQVRVAKSGKPAILTGEIAAHLRALSWPRYYLDFETVNPAIPPHSGTRPFEQLAFQASVHVQEDRGSKVEHHEFIDDGRQDPRPLLTEFLLDVVGDAGSTIAYNKPFEDGCLKRLAAPGGMTMPRHRASEKLLGMGKRLWDLADPFRKSWYAHPAFKGSWSLKNVLPVCVPDMTYADLKIKNGAEAMAAYKRLMTADLSDAERAEILASLKVYCGQDTWAMVRLLDHLEEVVGAVKA